MYLKGSMGQCELDYSYYGKIEIIEHDINTLSSKKFERFPLVS